jgi:hypothetical protein
MMSSFPVNYWSAVAAEQCAQGSAVAGAGGSSFAKGEAQQGARRGQRNRTQTGMM